MPKTRLYLIVFVLFACVQFSSTQTTLLPGDIAVLGVVTDMGLCGLPPESDEISFVCFHDITNGTVIDLTDNGWEGVNSGFWSDAEGTLRMTRNGGTIAKGTVITLHGQNTGGLWTYKVASPDINWNFTYLNGPLGGPLNLEDGGDQIYFMQGGTWDNQGGGLNKAIYSGRVLTGFNTLTTWSADGTNHQSNLHPNVIPCYHMESGGSEYAKYTGLFTATDQFGWLKRIQDGGNWTTFADCSGYTAAIPQYPSGYQIPIEDLELSISCFACEGCPPFNTALIFNLPSGPIFNVVYTNGVDTFELFEIMDGYAENITLDADATYSLVSVEEVGGCPILSNFTGVAEINVPQANAGTHGEIWACANEGYYALWYFLGGNPDGGGFWDPPLFMNMYYVTDWGPGTYTYIIPADPPHLCPPDTASVTIYHVNIDSSIVDIGCDNNGTPYDITDDRTVVTLNIIGYNFGPDYNIEYANPYDVTPTYGLSGQPQTFYFEPGSATGPNSTFFVKGAYPLWCEFFFSIPAPGYCSDPCDPDMYSTVSGPEDICISDCPDEPGTINIDIFGGQWPYAMDFELSAPGYLPWTFTNVEIDNHQEIQICVDNVPAPVYDAASATLIIPVFLAGSSLSIDFLALKDTYDCVGSPGDNEVIIQIHPPPPIDTTKLTFCYDDALDVDLTEYDEEISLTLDVSWFNGDPEGGGNQIFNANTANLTEVDQLYAQVADDYCENSILIPLTILPKPELDTINPIAICQGTVLNLLTIPLTDLGNSAPTYTYHASLPPDSTNILNPLVYMPTTTDTIYVLATAAICFDTLPIIIQVEEYPDFTLEGLPCDLLQGTYSILFTSDADSIYSTAGVVFNNPAGQDLISGITNDTSVIIEIYNPTNLCADTFAIQAPNCNCPLINQPAAIPDNFAICEGESIPVMTVSVAGGLVANWYDVPSGGTPLLANSLSFQPSSAVNAIYYVEAFDPTTACYSIRTPVTLTVHPLAVLQSLDDIQICDEETINLSTVIPGILNGVAGSGSWYNLTTHQVVTGIVQPQNGDAWYFLFTSNPGNCVSVDTMAAVVHPLPAIDLYDIVCDDVLLTYDLFFTIQADVIATSTGTLVQGGSADSFSLVGIPYDTDVQFAMLNVGTGCAADLNFPAPDCSCPALLDIDNSRLCSDQGLVDMATFEGPGVNGTWELVSTPPGTNPATLSGSVFDGLDADAGTYVLRFIRSIILANCVDTAVFQLQVSQSPYADAGSDATVCAPDVIQLTGSAGGSNVQYGWQTSGSGAIASPNTLITSYTPTLADITAGTVNFTLTAFDQSGFCPAASESIDITIDGSAYYILSPGLQTYCDTADLLIDLDPLISFGTTGGTWFFPDTVSAPVIGSSQINPSTLTAGSYTIYYATSNAVAPCEDDTTAVSLLIENCACPSVAVNVPTEGLCSESDALDLNTLLITSETGTWSIINTPSGTKPAQINGSDFVTNQSDAGLYRIRFILSNPVAGCPSTAEIEVLVIATPVLNIISVECADDLQSWVAVISSTSAALVNSLGNVVPLGNNQYRIEGITLETLLQVSASSGNGLCTEALNIPYPDCECTLTITNLPDEVSLCAGETIILEGEVQDPKGAVTSFWIVSNDSLYQNELEVDQPGNYQFVSYDELGCRQEHTVEVSYYQEMVASLNSVDITCPGDNDGQIILQDIVGGSGPFFISVNGVGMQQLSGFPYLITGLGAGNYDIELLDGFGCRIEVLLEIASASSETLSLGPDQTILAGDSIGIDPVLSFIPDSFYWTGDLIGLLNGVLLGQWIRPEEDQHFTLFAIDDKGCLYSDELNIRVLLNSNIYVASVFSPNGDGINDILAPQTDPSITLIQYFEIYSRWGELVYSAKDFVPNQGTEGWDGKLNEQEMMPGVFVYRMGAVNKRGQEFIKYGDVTLIR